MLLEHQCHGQGIAPVHNHGAGAQAARGRRGGQDDATEDKGRTGEKGEEGDGRENVMGRDQGTNLDISGEAFGPTGRKALLFLQLKNVLHEEEKQRQKEQNDQTTLTSAVHQQSLTVTQELTPSASGGQLEDTITQASS
eukprot:bmy_01543T0